MGTKCETIEEAAKRIWMECYPNWLDNGLAIKNRVAKDYAIIVSKSIIKETLDEYTNDENHERVKFWNDVINELKTNY